MPESSIPPELYAIFQLRGWHVFCLHFPVTWVARILLLVGRCLDVPMQGMRFGISALCTNRVYESLR